jgi:hypothetical protein
MSHLPQEGGGTMRPVRIVSVPDDVPLTVLFLDGFQGLLTHFIGTRRRGRSVPCKGNDCETANHRTRKIWKGYAPVLVYQPLERFWLNHVLEITEALEEVLHDVQLRGQQWMLSRQQESKSNLPVTGLFCESWPLDQVPQAFNVEPVLKRFYHCDALKLGVPNPVPPRLILEPQSLRAPTMPAVLATEELAQRPVSREEMNRLLEQARAAGLIPQTGHSTNGSKPNVAKPGRTGDHPAEKGGRNG